MVIGALYVPRDRGNFRLGNYDTSFLLALTHTKASLLVIFHFPREPARSSPVERDLIQFSKESSAASSC